MTQTSRKHHLINQLHKFARTNQLKKTSFGDGAISIDFPVKIGFQKGILKLFFRVDDNNPSYVTIAKLPLTGITVSVPARMPKQVLDKLVHFQFLTKQDVANLAC